MTFRTIVHAACLAGAFLLVQTEAQAAHVQAADLLIHPRANWLETPGEDAFAPAGERRDGAREAQAAVGAKQAVELDFGVDTAAAMTHEDAAEHLRARELTWLNMFYTQARVVDPVIPVAVVRPAQSLIKPLIRATNAAPLPRIEVRQQARADVDLAQVSMESRGVMRFMISVFQFFGEQMRATKALFGLTTSIE